MVNAYISETLDNGGQVDVVYTDFSKAFDRVSHPILLEKLWKFGVRDPLLRWCADYLTGRSQLVKLGDSISQPILVTSGVPQGSYIGPPFFLVLINDLPDIIKHCISLLFADDAKFLLRIDSPISPELLQSDLRALENWCDRNEMQLNVDKCSILRYGTKKSLIFFPYRLYNTPLSVAREITDLGVIFSSNFSFKALIERIKNKSLRILGLLNRILPFKNLVTYKRLYESLVRPVIALYASPIWSPYLKVETSLLESVQHKYMRQLVFLNGTPMDLSTTITLTFNIFTP